MKIISIIFFLSFILVSNLSIASEFVICKYGAAAFSSVSSYDKFCKYTMNNDDNGIIELINTGKIKFVEQDTVFNIISSTNLVSAGYLIGSDKLWAIPKIFLNEIKGLDIDKTETQKNN